MTFLDNPASADHLNLFAHFEEKILTEMRKGKRRAFAVVTGLFVLILLGTCYLAMISLGTSPTQRLYVVVAMVTVGLLNTSLSVDRQKLIFHLVSALCSGCFVVLFRLVVPSHRWSYDEWSLLLAFVFFLTVWAFLALCNNWGSRFAPYPLVLFAVSFLIFMFSAIAVPLLLGEVIVNHEVVSSDFEYPILERDSEKLLAYECDGVRAGLVDLSASLVEPLDGSSSYHVVGARWHAEDLWLVSSRSMDTSTELIVAQSGLGKKEAMWGSLQIPTGLTPVGITNCLSDSAEYIALGDGSTIRLREKGIEPVSRAGLDQFERARFLYWKPDVDKAILRADGDIIVEFDAVLRTTQTLCTGINSSDPYSIRVGPNGERLAYFDDDGKALVVRGLASQTVTQIAQMVHPAFNSDDLMTKRGRSTQATARLTWIDGIRIVYVARAGVLRIVDIETRRSRSLSECNSRVIGLNWNSGNQELIWTSLLRDRSRIHRLILGEG